LKVKDLKECLRHKVKETCSITSKEGTVNKSLDKKSEIAKINLKLTIEDL